MDHVCNFETATTGGVDFLQDKSMASLEGLEDFQQKGGVEGTLDAR